MTSEVIAAAMNQRNTEALFIRRHTMQRLPLAIILTAFSVLSALALWHHGYWGILAPHFQSFGGAQVLVDLVIALSLVMVWIWRNARETGRNPWPWIALTLVAGSIGPLIYLLSRKASDDSR
jgi:uncharacterized membrane protein YfcA